MKAIYGSAYRLMASFGVHAIPQTILNVRSTKTRRRGQCLPVGQFTARRPSVATTCCLLTVTVPRGHWAVHLLCVDHLYRSTWVHLQPTADTLGPLTAANPSCLYCSLQRRSNVLLCLLCKIHGKTIAKDYSPSSYTCRPHVRVIYD